MCAAASCRSARRVPCDPAERQGRPAGARPGEAGTARAGVRAGSCDQRSQGGEACPPLPSLLPVPELGIPTGARGATTRERSRCLAGPSRPAPCSPKAFSCLSREKDKRDTESGGLLSAGVISLRWRPFFIPPYSATLYGGAEEGRLCTYAEIGCARPQFKELSVACVGLGGYGIHRHMKANKVRACNQPQ